MVLDPGSEIPEKDPIVDPRYQVLEILGRGGMGIVYKVQDRVDGRIVALKTLLGSDPAAPGAAPDEEEDRRRFEREIRALARLNHPNIVKLHDVGRRDGRTYFTMEYLPGLSLDAFLPRPPPDPVEIRWILRVVLEVLEALEHLHRAGLVHRDLKPSNIMVLRRDPPGEVAPADRPPGAEEVLAEAQPAVKVLDFGLSDPREAAAGGKGGGGTPLYMAPEAIDPSRPPDPRSDLYSVGVILYALVARRLPHATLASALSGRSPAAPSALNRSCPGALAEVILRLLDPAPFRRYVSAGEASRALRRILDGDAVPAEAGPRLLPPAFVGREDVRETILGLLAEVARGRPGRLVLVSGMPGSGKTWLLEQGGLKQQAVLEHRIPYFQGRYLAGGPLRQGLREVVLALLLDRARDPGSDSLAEELGPWGGTLLELLGIDDAPALRIRRQAAAGEASADLGAGRAVQAAAALFRAAAARPGLVLLDDLHEADEIDLQILAGSLRAVRDLPFLVIATYRPDALDAAPALKGWIEGAAADRDGRILPLHLGPLNDGEAARMVASMLSPPGEVDPSLLGEILDESGGLPRSLEASVGARWAAGRIRFAGGAWRPAPPSAEVVAAGDADRLAGLDGSDREALLAASVLGEGFELELLRRLLSTGEEGEGRGASADLLARLHRLAARGLLAETADGFAFRPGLRGRLEALLPAGRRRELHSLAAGALLGLAGEASADRWDAIAQHLQEGGDLAGALQFHLKAARRAARLYANRRAIAAYRSALPLAAEADREGLRIELARLLVRLGEYEEALDCYRSVLDSGGSPGLLGEVGRIHQRRGDLARAIECYEACLGEAGEDQEALALARYLLGAAAFDRGDLAAAADHFAASLEICRGRDDPEGMLKAHDGLGLVEKRRKRLDEARRHFREMLVCAERIGSEERAAIALNNLGNLHRARGEDQEAIGCFRRAIGIRERIGDRPGLAICLNNLSRLALRQGDLAGAGEAALRALRTFEEIGNRRGILIASGNIGVVQLFRGDFGPAREAFLRARALAEGLPDRRALADAGHCLGRLEASRGEAVEAHRCLREALAVLGPDDDRDLRIAILAELALARLDEGDPAGAEEALREASALAGDAGSGEIRGSLRSAGAAIDLARDRPDKALADAREGLALLESGGGKIDIALAHRRLGQVYRELGPDQVDRADRHLGMALAMFEEMGARFEWAMVQGDVGRLWELLGEGDEAAARYQKALAALAALDAPRRAREIAGRLTALEGGEGR